jgi:hypothetical protein
VDRRRLALLLAIAVVALLLRVLWGGRAECGRAADEIESGRPYQAVLHYERAVRWYLPGSPYSTRAVNALWALGQDAEDAGEPELALFAFRGLRASAHATRSFYQPYPRRIDAAEERIAALMTADPVAAWPDRALSTEQRRAIVLDNLRDHQDPATGWVIVLELGFLAWLGGGAALAWRIGRPGRRRRTTWILIGTVCSGYVLWILGMWLA